eukprot:1176064-Prorocentrum_minimum.AAC.1
MTARPPRSSISHTLPRLKLGEFLRSRGALLGKAEFQATGLEEKKRKYFWEAESLFVFYGAVAMSSGKRLLKGL